MEVSADPITAFSYRLLTHVEDLVSNAKPPVETFSFGPLVVEMQVVGDVLRQRLTRAIEFARLSESYEPRSVWQIRAIDGKPSGIGAPPYRITSRQHLDRLHNYERDQLSVRYNPITLTWSACFGARRLAAIWTADVALMPDWDDAAPCRELFHRMILPTECFLAHAAGIGVGGRGVLLTGRSGSGKSTTTAAAVTSGLVTAGDDFVLVDPRSRRTYALYDSLKLDSRSGQRFAELTAHAANANRDPSEKCRVHLARSHPSGFARQLPIDAVLLAQADGARKTSIVPATPGEAMRALVPSTICLVRGGEAETIHKSTLFLRNMRAFRCDLGSDPKEAIATISAFVNDLSP
jgi:hypothetical protein